MVLDDDASAYAAWSESTTALLIQGGDVVLGPLGDGAPSLQSSQCSGLLALKRIASNASEALLQSYACSRDNQGLLSFSLVSVAQISNVDVIKPTHMLTVRHQMPFLQQR
jgi:hypothetical protein